MTYLVDAIYRERRISPAGARGLEREPTSGLAASNPFGQKTPWLGLKESAGSASEFAAKYGIFPIAPWTSLPIVQDERYRRRQQRRRKMDSAGAGFYGRLASF